MKRRMRSQVKITKKASSVGEVPVFALVVVAFVLVALFLATLIYSIFFRPKNMHVANPTPTLGEPGSLGKLVTTKGPTPTATPGLFVSKELGISFRYKPKAGNISTYTKQVGQKVYLYSDSQEYTGTDEAYLRLRGQYLEVFKKDAKDSLADAVRKKFLTNVSEKDCFPVEKERYGLPASYKTVTLSYPGSGGPYNPASEKCPTPYTQVAGAAYFVMDPAHPEIYVFFLIGQYLIMADESTPWQNTITFL